MDRAHDFLAVSAGEADREVLLDGPVIGFVGGDFVGGGGEMMAQGDEIETMRAGGVDGK